MKLREYQEKAVKTGEEFFKQKKASPSLMVCPTAYGKSYVIGALADRISGKTIILQPTKELLDQNYEKYLLTGKQAAIFSASKKQKEIGDVTFATIGSVIKVASQLKREGFKNLIIDEAHLFPRASEGQLIRFIKEAGMTHILGLTATPIKLHNKVDYFTGESASILRMLTTRAKNGTFFKDIIYVSQIKEMVDGKFWSPIVYENFTPLENSQLVYNTTKSEYTEESLALFYEKENIEGKILAMIEEKRKTRKSILVAVPSVAQAMSLASQIPNAKAVWGNMDPKEREIAIRDFKNLSLQVVVQVNVLSVGFDHPELDCLIMGRPTASISWYYQFIGRGTRIHSNKTDCNVIDFSGNIDRFGKIEDLYFVQEFGKWKMYGKDGILLSDVPISDFGKHTHDSEAKKQRLLTFGKYEGKTIDEVPHSYLQWLSTDFRFTPKNKHLKLLVEEKLNQTV